MGMERGFWGRSRFADLEFIRFPNTYKIGLTVITIGIRVFTIAGSLTQGCGTATPYSVLSTRSYTINIT